MANTAPRGRVRRATVIGAAVLLMWGAAISYSVERYLGGDYRALLRLGSDFRHPAVLAGAPIENGLGYDGQFFAALATDPFLRRPDTSSYFDVPSYRATRVGLPLLAWILAAGNESAAIWLYQLACWLLAAILVWVVACWLEDEGHSPWWAASIGLSGGMVASIFSSLPDAAACTLMVLALAYEHRTPRSTALVLTVSALVKETQLATAAAMAVSALRRARYRRAFLLAALPVTTLVGWTVYVHSRPGFSDLEANANFGVPFAWVPEKLETPLDAQEAIALIGLGLGFLALVALLPSIRRWSSATYAYAGFASVALFLTRMVYVPVWWNYSRVLLPLPVLAVVLAERELVTWRRWLLRAVSLSWAAVGAILIYRWAAGLTVVLLVAALLYRGKSRPAPVLR